MTADGSAEPTVRQARADDTDAVAGFTTDTWDRFDGGDYIPEVFPEWVETDGADQRTVVTELPEDPDAAASDRPSGVVGLCQGVLLSEHEAWAQGLRVAPDARGHGIAAALTEQLFEWARDRGATVCRAMVFSWNVAGLGTARGVGFDPRTEFRWVRLEPDSGAGAAADFGTAASGDGEPDLAVERDPDAAWGFWQRSAARDRLGGLALDPEETWALSECTRERFRRVADETAVFAVQGPKRTRGAAFRTRTVEREVDGETERLAEYGVAAWDSVPAARALFGAIARDAAALGADGTRVLVPETAGHVSDAAYAGVSIGDEPDFVVEADLTGTGTGD